jgi:hypothetical protein
VVLLKQPTKEPPTMKKITTQITIHTVGLDIAKNSFSPHGFDEAGNTVLTKELKSAPS